MGQHPAPLLLLDRSGEASLLGPTMADVPAADIHASAHLRTHSCLCMHVKRDQRTAPAQAWLARSRQHANERPIQHHRALRVCVCVQSRRTHLAGVLIYKSVLRATAAHVLDRMKQTLQASTPPSPCRQRDRGSNARATSCARIHHSCTHPCVRLAHSRSDPRRLLPCAIM